MKKCKECFDIKDFDKRIIKIMDEDGDRFSVHYKMISQCIFRCASDLNLCKEYKLCAIRAEARWKSTTILAKHANKSSIGMSVFAVVVAFASFISNIFSETKLVINETELIVSEIAVYVMFLYLILGIIGWIGFNLEANKLHTKNKDYERIIEICDYLENHVSLTLQTNEIRNLIENEKSEE